MGPPDGPEMGAQFAQLVKELRSEYGGAVQACAFRISQVGVPGLGLLLSAVMPAVRGQCGLVQV